MRTYNYSDDLNQDEEKPGSEFFVRYEFESFRTAFESAGCEIRGL